MKNKLHNLGIVIFIGTILFIGILAIRNRTVLSLNHKYTIGTVYNFEAEKGGFRVEYKYMVSAKTFHATSIVNDKHEAIIGKRFYVSFYPPNPRNSEILIDKPVQDSLKEAPSNGWEKLNFH